mmetsp:Transcript_15322/g.41996  ORF Transcript_15322/g.41996 Transcript_15322/m.41996 type:complete len:256 (-) Transcript_15322:139-906(-)
MAFRGSHRRGSAPTRVGAILVAIVFVGTISTRSFTWAIGGTAWHHEIGRRYIRAASAKDTIDTFDPWSVLGISPNAGKAEARKAYKSMIAKYHPDVNPGADAQAKFEQIVRAHAVVTGEDKDLDQASLLKNAVENLRNDMEFRQQRIAQLKAEALAEEEEIEKMKTRLTEAASKREEVTTELGAFGGAAIGLLVGGPTGLIVGAVAGLALKDREDAMGQVIRGTGSVAKGFGTAVTKMFESSGGGEGVPTTPKKE